MMATLAFNEWNIYLSPAMTFIANEYLESVRTISWKDIFHMCERNISSSVFY